MATAICLDCRWTFGNPKMIDGWDTKNLADHHIVIIAKGNIIEGIEARD